VLSGLSKDLIIIYYCQLCSISVHYSAAVHESFSPTKCLIFAHTDRAICLSCVRVADTVLFMIDLLVFKWCISTYSETEVLCVA